MSNLDDYIPKPKKKKLSFIPNVDIKEFLAEKGIDFKDAGRWVHLQCLYPDHDDSNPSFSIDTEVLAFNCYGCQRSGTWSKLCEDMGWAVDLQPVVGEVSRAIWGDVQRALQGMEQANPVGHISFHLPMGYRPLPMKDCKQWEYLNGRGFPPDAIKDFDLGYTPAGSRKSVDPDYGKEYWGRVVIPVHDENGNYIWPEGRLIQDSKRPKYWRPKGVRKELFLFNYHRVKELYTDYVILVEGIMDPISLWYWGLPGVCSFGAGISQRQIELLVSRWTTLYIAFDMDKAGIKAWADHKDILRVSGCNIRRIKMPRGQDPNSLGPEKFLEYFEKSEIFYG